MLRLHEERILPNTIKELFDLVLDIESYPSFLPYCLGSKKISGSLEEGEITAEVTVKFGFMEKKYTSLIKPNFEDDHATIDIIAVTGPFKHLRSHWDFKSLEEGTRVSFSLDLEFESPLLNKMMSGYLREAYTKMMSAFEKRSRSIYEQKNNPA